MSNITDWIKYELYPTLYQSIDRAFPEHSFTSFSGGWRSATTLYGTPHDRKDKTVVTKRAPGRILEQGGDTLSLVDYVMRRDRVAFIQAVKTLADVAGLKLPQGDFKDEDWGNYSKKSSILEHCNSYFVSCLQMETREAKRVRWYLEEMRGYGEFLIADMELGYIPSKEELYNHLQNDKGHNLRDIEETIKLTTGIGTTHVLTIPYRSGGSIKGFKFRTIGDDTPKYLNSTGLDKLGGFFNLSGIKGNKDLVIVEGELDSLSTSVCPGGLENVVASGGSSISSEQVREAIRRGAKSFTLCFDYEPDKEEQTARGVNKAIDVILGEGVNRVYVASLFRLDYGSSDKVDPDSLTRARGVEAFRKVIDKAIPYYEYRLQETLNKYGSIEEATGLEAKDIDRLLDEVVGIASQIPDAIDRDKFKKLFTSLEAVTALGITEESLSITVDRLTSTRDKEEQERDFKKLLSDASKLQDKGETDKALELLSSRVREVQLRDKVTEFSNLLKPITEEEITKRLANKPESIDSGYTIKGEPLLLPSGAISIIVAPTSHGKTTFLMNLALNVAGASSDKEAYFFSYEEDGDSILVNALNTYHKKPLSKNNRRSIKSYLATGSTEYFAEGVTEFRASKDRFFAELIETKRLSIHYTNYNSETLVEAIRYLHKYANPGVVFIDYIQLLNLPDGKYKTYSRQEEIKQICIALKDVAVETGLPIVLGAQFNRTVVSVEKMHATNIGEAGDIERIANLIVAFWNNNFKQVGTEGELSGAKERFTGEKDSLSVTILKNRGGVVGEDETLSFNGNTGSISNKESQAKSLFN